MRKILIDDSIRSIAESYKHKVHAHGHYENNKVLINPRKKLDALLKAFKDGDVKIDAGKPLPTAISKQMQSYLELLIKKYDDGLLDASPSVIESLNAEFDKAILDPKLFDLQINVKKTQKTTFHNRIVTALMYNEIRHYIYPQYIRQLRVKACVYCNAAFCVTDSQGKAYYTADHWKPKSRYPHFAISFFNLVPCCFSCNCNKGEDDVGYFCLFEEDSKADRDVLRLKISDKDIAMYIMNHKADNLVINLIEAHDTDRAMREHMDQKLHISAIYSEHRDVAEEALWRRIAYNASNIEALNQLLKGSSQKLTNTEVQRFIYGTFYDRDDMHMRPLTRLIHGLMEDIDG